MATRRRGAFTLVELLVVITIIGMLMALLLPAVNAAVESGRNTQCRNNIRQLAIAADSFQSNKGFYPGYQNTLMNSAGTATTVSWVVSMLPEFERLDLYKDYVDSAITTKPTPYLELLVCPSDPPEQIGGAVLSYVANSGCGTTDPPGATATKNGLFHTTAYQSNVDTIVDGKSNTIVFAENIQATTWNLTTRPDTTFVFFNVATPTATHKINGNKTTATTNLESARPSSFHSGGVNVAFCDTHVLFLKEEVDYGVYSQLMTPNYREADVNTLVGKSKQPLNDADYK